MLDFLKNGKFIEGSRSGEAYVTMLDGGFKLGLSFGRKENVRPPFETEITEHIKKEIGGEVKWTGSLLWA